MNSEAFPSNFSASISAGRGGSLPPSYHVSVQAGISPRTGNWKRRMAHFGGVSEHGGAESTISTLLGAPSFNAQFAPSIMWQPMSPSAPQPKSHHARHATGRYTTSPDGHLAT